jgi:hypothetical protein
MISMSSDFVIIDPWASLDILKRATRGGVSAALKPLPLNPGRRFAL